MEKIFLLVFCLLMMSSSWAQIKDIEFMLGPNVGTLRSNVTDPVFETKANYRGKMGYSAGIGSSYYFNEKFSLGAQLLYQRTTIRGSFLFEDKNGTGNLDLTTSFDNISLPVRARYTVGHKVKFNGEFGGFINYLLNSTAKDYFLYDSRTPNYLAYNSMTIAFAEASGQYTRFDAGLSLALSTQVSLGEKLTGKLSLSDNYGLVNISDLQFYQLPIRSSHYLKSNTMNLLAGIVYSLH